MIITGDALAELKKLDSGSVQTCITSPPYWGLRDYGVEGQIGLEDSPEAYVSTLVEIIAEVKRVLKSDGTLWLVLGDSYASGGTYANNNATGKSTLNSKPCFEVPMKNLVMKKETGLKPKDLCMIPARVALALQADGWYLRSDIIWHKPNPMPESVTDRPTSAHEHIFLLAKSARYYYDGPAIEEPMAESSLARYALAASRIPEESDRYKTGEGRCSGRPSNVDGLVMKPKHHYKHEGDIRLGREAIANPNRLWQSPNELDVTTRNKRNVWTVATQPYPEAHFAVYPPALIEPCVLAGSREGDTVLDPFCGSGTTGEVALKHRRKFIGIELNPEYVKLAEKRLREVQVAMF